MPAISSPDLAIYRAGQPTIRRYLSVAPRTSVYTATVSAVSTDDETGGIHQLTLTGGAGDLADVYAGYTVDIGTAAGKRDIGQFRVRKTPSGANLDIGETASGACPVQVGHHVTIRAERRLWRVQPRIVGTRGDDGYLDTFTDYADYDIPYTDQNDAIQPHANITTDANGTSVRPAGFVDAGEAYRTVTLHAGASIALANGASIASRLWDVSDGTIISGTTSSAAITVRFPAGFRYISLTVTDTGGKSHTRYLPIWAHDDDNPPLTAFRVIRDVRTANTGREIELEFFGADDSLNESHLPEGTTLCYWESATFGASGTPTPASQTDAMLGWALRDAETLRIGDNSRIRVEIGGLPAWLDRIAVTPQTLRDLGITSLTWDTMRHITADRAAHFALRRWSNALDLANFYPSGVTDETLTYTIDGVSLWRALVNVAASGRVSVVGGDSLNGLWIRRDFNHLSAAERSTRSTVAALTSADWLDADGLTVETKRAHQIGAVDGRGSAWDGTNAPTTLAACAPGRTTGAGTGRAKLPAQILPNTDAQTVLNALVGHRYAALTNPRSPIKLRLLHPIDALEPAWNEPVTLTWNSGGLRDTALSALACMVERVEIEHTNDADKPPKIVRWTLIPTTSGEPGEAVPVIITPTTTRPPTPPRPPRPPSTPGINPSPNTARIAVFVTDNRIYRTTNFLATSPRWTSVNLSSLANWGGGVLNDFAVDPFSPAYIGGGSAVNGWIVTSTHVQRVLDIFGTVTLGTATALGGTPIFRQMIFERGVQNWGIVAWYQGYDGVTIRYTTDGTTWTQVNVNPNYDVNLSHAPRPGLWLNPHHAGHARVGIMTNTHTEAGIVTNVAETFDYGATWTPLSSPISTGMWTAGTILVPYQNGISTMFTGKTIPPSPHKYRLLRDGADISPTVSGTPYGLTSQNESVWRRAAISDSDANMMAFIGVPHQTSNLHGLFCTRNALSPTPTWQTVIAPSSSMPYRGVYLAGDDGSTLYLIGNAGAVGKSTVTASGTIRIQSKKGNLSTSGTIVGLCGG